MRYGSADDPEKNELQCQHTAATKAWGLAISITLITVRMSPGATLPGRTKSQAGSNDYVHTIFMTPEESNRMRKTVQTRLQKCREQKGQPRKPRDRKEAVSEATQAALMADMSGEPDQGMSTSNRDDAMVALAVGVPFEPSTAKLEDLTPMNISELQIETHHRGRVLNVRRAQVRVRLSAPAVPLVAYSWTVVEDDAGEVERLEVYLHKNKGGEDMLEAGPWFKIKEPYFTINEQGEPTIRVHHPSDLIRMPDEQGGKIIRTPQKCKDLGNAALKKKEFWEARDFYTQGLESKSKPGEEDISKDIHRNRAHVNLILSRFDEAKADGMAAITGIADEKHKLLDSKAKFRAGSAAYSLGEFHEAQKLFEEALSLSPEDKDAQIYLRNIEARLREQQTGDYNFNKMRLRLSPARSRVDAATFSRRIKTDDSPLGGRGMFATQDLQPGDLILCEKAFRVAWSHEKDAWTAMTFDARDDRIRAFPAGLSKVVVQKLLNNPSQIPRVTSLYSDWRSDNIGTKTLIGEDGPVVDTFQIHDLICRNAFGPGPVDPSQNEDARHASTGLWLLAATANHSCLANATKEFIGDMLILRAARPIATGEEITHCYDESSDYDSRREKLEITWGFKCHCPLCEAEVADGEDLRRKRRELEGSVAAFLDREHPSGNSKKMAVMKAEKLAREIRGTYDEERYRDLPRRALGPIQAWLEKVVKK